jgi:hypothetical protein
MLKKIKTKYDWLKVIGGLLIFMGFLGSTSGINGTHEQMFGGLFISLIGIILFIIGYYLGKKNTKKAVITISVIIIILTIIIAGYFLIFNNPNKVEMREITIQGHAETYTFTNDIRESLKVPVNDEFGIRQMFLENDRFNIIFDGSSMQDNAYFRIVLINLAKISIFFSYESKVIGFDYYYYVGEQWYNSTNENITRPELHNVIWLKGPSTGATDTSLILNGSTVYLQGTDYKNLTLAGDKLTLLVFGIDRVD